MCQQDEDLRARLSDAWLEQNPAGFYALLMDLADRVRSSLSQRHGLGPDDIEECVATAYERLLERHMEPLRRSEIRSPYNYFFTIAVNAARDLHRVNSMHVGLVDFDGAVAPGIRDGEDGIPLYTRSSSDLLSEFGKEVAPEWAALVVEEIAEDCEVLTPTWAIAVVRLALSRLTPKLRVVVEHLAAQDLDGCNLLFNSQSAQRELGLSPAAFRKNKERAFNQLRTLIPWAVRELGVTPPPRIAVAIFEERRPPIPSED
jgi:DNA-directed RNA polymerase specialized sigma24 family protein